MEENSKTDESNSCLNLYITDDDSSSEDSDESFCFAQSNEGKEVQCDDFIKYGSNGGNINDRVGNSTSEIVNSITTSGLGNSLSTNVDNEKIMNLINSKVANNYLNSVPDLEIDSNIKEIYKCPKCNSISNILDHHEIHLTTHLLIKPYACLFCNYETFYFQDLESHKNMHSEYNIPLKKFEMKLKSDCPVALKQSVKLGTVDEPKSQWDFISPSMDCTTDINSVSSLPSPKCANLILKELILCYHCDFTTTTNFALKRHYNDKHPKVNYELLDNVSTTIDQNGIRVFSCSLCPFATLTFRGWHSHWLVHFKSHKTIDLSSSTVHGCDIGQCPYKTLSSSSLLKHKRTQHIFE